MPRRLSSVWSHSVHFAKYPKLKFQKATTAPTVFIQVHTLWKVWYSEGIQVITFLAICQVLQKKKYGNFETQGLKISKCYSCIHHTTSEHPLLWGHWLPWWKTGTLHF